MFVAEYDVDVVAVAAAGDDTPVRDLRQDHGDLYQAPLQAIHLGNQTVWRTLL